MRRPPPLLEAPHLSIHLVAPPHHQLLEMPLPAPSRRGPAPEESRQWVRKAQPGAQSWFLQEVESGGCPEAGALSGATAPTSTLREAATMPHLASQPLDGGGASWVPPWSLLALERWFQLEQGPETLGCGLPPASPSQHQSPAGPRPAVCWGRTSLNLFSISSLPGQVSHAPVHPRGTQRLASAELSTWEGGPPEHKVSPTHGALWRGAGFSLPGPRLCHPVGWMSVPPRATR